MRRGLVIVLFALATACSADDDDEQKECPLNQPYGPTGSIRWTDGVLHLPDHVNVYHEGNPEPLECAFEPSQSDEDAIAFTCQGGIPGPATLSVLLDQQRWNTPFELDQGECSTLPLTLDLELDPAAGK